MNGSPRPGAAWYKFDMSSVILRRTRQSPVSPEEAVALVKASRHSRLLHHSGNNLLIETRLDRLPELQAQLTGWIVSPQSEPIRVPDTRLKIRAAGGQ